MSRHEAGVESVRIDPDGTVTALRAWEALEGAPVPQPVAARQLQPWPADPRRRQRRVLWAMAGAFVALVALLAVVMTVVVEAVGW